MRVPRCPMRATHSCRRCRPRAPQQLLKQQPGRPIWPRQSSSASSSGTHLQATCSHPNTYTARQAQAGVAGKPVVHVTPAEATAGNAAVLGARPSAADTVASAKLWGGKGSGGTSGGSLSGSSGATEIKKQPMKVGVFVAYPHAEPRPACPSLAVRALVHPGTLPGAPAQRRAPWIRLCIRA